MSTHLFRRIATGAALGCAALVTAAAVVPSHAQAASAVKQKPHPVYIATGQSLRGKALYKPSCHGKFDCGLSGDSTAFLYRMHWTMWTTGKAVGTGTYLLNSCTPNCAQGRFLSVPIVVTFTHPAKACVGKSARWYWTEASFRYPKGLPRQLQGANAPANPWVFTGLIQDIKASCR
ncbi:MAG TPA: hypothetical protein VKU39_09960 [Streptosporangiaceae bacterium]|nr:hypothetical protein [Streptosporangiaceae bacterium]